MSETVSVEEAIENGRKTISKPVQIIQIATFVICGVLCYCSQFPVWAYFCVIPVAVIVPWIYWSFKITKWRIWAFENVRNVRHLKERAIKEKLIWPDGSIFEKTEIRTPSDKEKLKAIQKKLEQMDD